MPHKGVLVGRHLTITLFLIQGGKKIREEWIYFSELNINEGGGGKYSNLLPNHGHNCLLFIFAQVYTDVNLSKDKEGRRTIGRII